MEFCSIRHTTMFWLRTLQTGGLTVTLLYFLFAARYLMSTASLTGTLIYPCDQTLPGCYIALWFWPADLGHSLVLGPGIPRNLTEITYTRFFMVHGVFCNLAILGRIFRDRIPVRISQQWLFFCSCSLFGWTLLHAYYLRSLAT
jgi:hypothetical protein